MTDTRAPGLAEAAAGMMSSALWKARLAEATTKADHWTRVADAHFAALVATYRPTDPAPLRALLEKLAASIGCNIISKGGQ